MNLLLAIFWITFLAGAPATGAYADEDGSAATEAPAVALVSTAPVVREALASAISAYGTVRIDPAHIQSVTLPREVVVTQIFVRPGEIVKRGDALMEVANTLQGATQYTQAENAVKYATADLARIRGLFADQMATRDQVAQAEKALADAQAQLAQANAAGAAQARSTVVAPIDSVVTEVGAKPGDTLQGGAPAMALGKRDALIVDLGLDPQDAPQVAPGDAVRLSSALNASIHIATTVSQVFGLVDPATHMVDAYAALPPGASADVFAGMVLHARIATRPVESIVVPRAALMEDEKGYFVYTVSGSAAHKTRVRVTIETGDKAGLSEGPQPGAEVVVSGNAALDDGTRVRTAGEPRKP